MEVLSPKQRKALKTVLGKNKKISQKNDPLRVNSKKDINDPFRFFQKFASLDGKVETAASDRLVFIEELEEEKTEGLSPNEVLERFNLQDYTGDEYRQQQNNKAKTIADYYIDEAKLDKEKSEELKTNVADCIEKKKSDREG
eukprot:GHVN01016234.1.p1 GENE.GHVN01016234.1~~GHVN01016234.1.p1  ORF type:complete len:142 (+),score=35.26 GHVN01016234.1:2-427(+)